MESMGSDAIISSPPVDVVENVLAALSKSSPQRRQMKKILAIDPGSEKSAWVYYEGGKVLGMSIDDNMSVVIMLRRFHDVYDDVAIEMIASYGMAVGKTVFETCVWIGRFIEAYESQSLRNKHVKVYRKDVKMYLCNSMRAKDSNIRQAIIDRYPAAGGGKTPQVGTKSQPGPLFGVAKDIWAALGVAITYEETRKSIS